MVAAILYVYIEQQRIRLIANVAKSLNPSINRRNRDCCASKAVDGLQQRQEIRHMRVRQIDLLAHTMMAQLFVNLARARVYVGLRVEVKRSFELDQDRCVADGN